MPAKTADALALLEKVWKEKQRGETESVNNRPILE